MDSFDRVHNGACVSDSGETEEGQSPKYSPTHSSQHNIQPLEIEDPTLDGKSSIPLAISNFLNSIVGAGIIGIPFAMRHTGLCMGLVLLSLVAGLTNASVQMLVKLGQQLKVNDYEKLASKIFGPRGFTLLCVLMFLLAFGAMLAYCIIIGDVVPDILGLESTSEVRSWSIVVCSLFSMLPLSLLKDMSSLAFTSSISVLADVVLVFVILIFSPVSTSLAAAGGFWSVVGNSMIRPKTVFAGLGAMSFAFVCHHSSFFVYGSLANPTEKRWVFVTRTSVGSAFTMCLLLGFVGYLGFLDETEGDILNNFADEGSQTGSQTALTLGRIMLALTMVFTYPMESFVARHAVCCLWWGEEETSRISDKRRYIVTIVLYLCALALSLAFSDLGFVLELTGAISASFLAYILPPAMYLCVHAQEFNSVVRQCGLEKGKLKFYPILWLSVKITDLSILKVPTSRNGGGEKQYRSANSSLSDEDEPVEIGGDIGELGEDGGWAKRMMQVFAAFKPFHLALGTLTFGLMAFFIGTITTFMSI